MTSPFGDWPDRFEPSDGPPVGLAVVLPGRAYAPSMPLLEFARQSLLQHGWAVQQVWWSAPALSDDDTVTWVGEQLRAAVGTYAGRVLVVGKSLGTCAAPYATKMGYDAVWLTPLLDFEPVVAALAASSARHLLVGGTADPMWDSDVARGLAAPARVVCEVPGADHAMCLPGDAVRSAEAHVLVTRAVHSFLGSLGG